jgi:hypothetical protein
VEIRKIRARKTVGIGANMTTPKSSIDLPLAEIEKNSIGFSESSMT